ncbi:MAG TPA: PTS sugar transporter subunit IIC [Gemmatimonadales bacterium]|jgi:PTS system mannose-specific IIC component|nr:PTS sugar transporter subunit IIC [Gemmatimonadales bacterium]
MSDPTLAALMLWAIVVGLDLASVLQGLLNRPLVAGAVAGVILGDPGAGLRIGAALELFALDVLPVGASRYPDYGAATVAAVVMAAHEPWVTALGPAVLLGVMLAQIGSGSIVVHRRVTAWALRRTAAALDRGEPGVATRVHVAGIIADLLRSGALAALGIGLATWLARVPWLDLATARALTIVAVAGGFVAAIGGALRRAGTARRIAWFAGGMALGVLGLALR